MKNLIKHSLVYISVSLPIFTLAYDTNGGSPIENPLKVNTISELIAAVLDLIVRIGTPLLVLAFVYVGFLFVAARGNEDGLTKAKSAFLYTAIGAALVLGAFVISEVIQNTISQLQ